MSYNLTGTGFKHQVGQTLNLCCYIRPPNENNGTFNYGLPGSNLPLRFDAPVVYALTVQDGAHANVADNAEAGYITGADPVFQDGDVSFHDEDVLWEPHGDTGSDASVTATGHALAAEVGDVVATGITVVTLTVQDAYNSNVSEAEVGYITGDDPVFQDGDVLWHDEDVSWEPHVGTGAANATPLGQQADADVGTVALSAAAAYTATGHHADADVGTSVARGAGSVAATGHQLDADAGTAAAAGAANAAATGHEFAADVGTATGAGAAAVGAVGAVADADVGVAVAVGVTAGEVSLTVEDGTHANVAGVPILSEISAAVIIRPRRRPAWYAPPEEKPEEEPRIDAEAFPRGVRARASVGVVVVKAGASVLPMADFSRSRVGVVVAAVDYTLRDQQEEEFIQILLAA